MFRNKFNIGSTVYWMKFEKANSKIPCTDNFTLKILKGTVVSSDRKTSYIHGEDGNYYVKNKYLNYCKVSLKKKIGLPLSPEEELQAFINL